MKFTVVTVIGVLAAATPVWADALQDDEKNVQADREAIHKDNAALQKDQEMLARHRAEKASAKAKDYYRNQAMASARIGADQTAIAEKKTEKTADKKILQHHKSKLEEDAAAPISTPGSSTY